jgi:polysaccharide biosynthesis protein VpsQ
MKNALSRYGPVLLFLLFLLYIIAAADKGAIPPFIRAMYHFPHGDWVGHFVLYGILAWLAARAFPRRGIHSGWKFPFSALFVILMAAIEELSQFLFPTRTPDLFDLSFGVLGTIVGTWLRRMKR